MKQSRGFTVIELLAVIVVVGTVATVLFIQKNNLAAAQRDDNRKTAINAMYYSLEEAFFVKNGYYPATINSKTLKSVDPDLFVDPKGVTIGESGSDYRYESTNCTNDKCKSYTLRASLEKEADYIKTSRDHN